MKKLTGRVDSCGALHQLRSSEVMLLTKARYPVCIYFLAISEPGHPSHSSYRPLTIWLSKGSASAT